MNMQSLMQQAQKMQNDINKSTKELEAMTFEETVGIIKVEVNGRKEILKVEILEKELDDVEMLEDMIMTAINNAMKKVDAEKEKKLGKYASAMGGLF